MSPKFSSRLEKALLFARGGASAHVAENTIESFSLALKLGATGLAGNVWLTADGVAVFHSSGTVGSRLKRKPLDSVERSLVPTASVDEIYAECGPDFELFLTLRDAKALDSVLRAPHPIDAPARLWLGGSDIEQVASWRPQTIPGRLVHVTSLQAMERGPEQHAARLRELRIDAVSLNHDEWSAGNVALFHRFGVLTIGGNVVHERQMVSLLNCGIDAMVSDHVDRMTESAAAVG